jgi:pimeloyl-ACP methyl ester carboxylesterase
MPVDFVFVRGLAREATHWGDLPDLFRERFPSCGVHCLDLPGNGVRFREASPVSMHGVAEALRAEYLERREGKRPCYALAVSFGGMAVADWAASHPGELAGAVLINTSFGAVSPPYRRLTPYAALSLLRIVLIRDAEKQERAVLKLTTHRADWPAETVARFTRAHRERPVSVRNVVRQLVAASCFHPPRKPPPGKFLLLSSAGDRLAHPTCSDAIARRWGVPLVRHPWAGHDLPLDDPEWVANAVSIWLSQP